VSLAKSFAIRTVAEWVGSDTDAALLQGFGVDYFQGFYFGEPLLEPEWGRQSVFQRPAVCPTPICPTL
jgi:EAL domain-containing protein (putative c-di-GMP-specific phosphodiesterase class I)